MEACSLNPQGCSMMAHLFLRKAGAAMHMLGACTQKLHLMTGSVHLTLLSSEARHGVAAGMITWHRPHHRQCRHTQGQASASAHSRRLVQGAFSEVGDVCALGVVIWGMSHQRRLRHNLYIAKLLRLLMQIPWCRAPSARQGMCTRWAWSSGRCPTRGV